MNAIMATIIPMIFAIIPIAVMVFIVYLIWKIKQNSDQILQLLREGQKNSDSAK
ncbi:MAG: hypothetical protein ACRCWD_06240 [Culicoidibacterales bacterium]